MIARDFDSFRKMVQLAEDKKLDYIILYNYNYSERGTYPHVYSFFLCTNLYTVTCHKKYEDGCDGQVRTFVKNHNCTEMNFSISDAGQVELKN